MHARYILTVHNQKYMQDIDIIRYRYYQCTHNGQKIACNIYWQCILTPTMQNIYYQLKVFTGI